VNKKSLVLAICMAFSAPTISATEFLPSNFFGVSLGEIQPKSFLNEPFKGIIPILFADIEAAKDLNIKLADYSVFQKTGAEKLPILDSLNFQISIKNNKPVIVISSSRPIQMPFLNFILEVEGPQGSIYQEFTTLLDPKGYSNNSFSNINAKPKFTAQVTLKNNEALLLESYSSTSVIKNIGEQKHTVRSGDTLSEIAKVLTTAEASLKKMISGIYRKNPNAFINNDINRLKAGATLEIPTQSELNSSNFKTAVKAAITKKQLVNQKINYSEKEGSLATDAYRIKRGDNLSKITKKLGHKGISFTKMMTAIYSANPHAFSKNKINLLKVGKILRIPSPEEVSTGRRIVAKKHNKQATKLVHPKLVKLDKIQNTNKIDSEESEKEFKLKGFVAEKGDTLASITKRIGHKGVSFTKMMKAIYVANPEAFEKDNITTLKNGAIIRLPSEAEMRTTGSNKLKLTPIVVPKLNEDKVKSPPTKEVVNLEKRVRELKRDLYKARANFSTLKTSLSKKENLLKEQSQELKELASDLLLIEEEENDRLEVAYANKSHAFAILNKRQLDAKKASLEIASITEQGQSIGEALLAAQIKGGYAPPDIGGKLADVVKNNLVDYSKYMSDREMLSSVLALLFGLFLIRYRREIYQYTRVSYDEYPSYYPPLGEEEARDALKEKPINFHNSYNERTNECESLVQELVDDLDNKNINNNSDDINWEEIHKSCDEYIAEYQDKQSPNKSSNNIPNNVENKQEKLPLEVL